MDGTNVSSDSLAAWAANGSMLRRDNPTADGVELLQWLLTSFGFQPGPHDGIFGGRTESAVIDYQEHRVLNPDGIVGPVTKADMLAAWRYGWAVGQVFPYPGSDSGLMVWGGVHPERGPLPALSGRVSWFGGPEDEGDRGYGQALVPVHPPKKAKALYEQWPELVEMGIFRRGVEDPLPRVTCCGRSMQAGISWMLDPESYYLAMRWGKGKARPDPRTNRVLIFRGKRGVVVAPTDWGPAAWTKKSADLSLGAIRAIGARTGDVARFAWADDNMPIGPVSL